MYNHTQQSARQSNNSSFYDVANYYGAPNNSTNACESPHPVSNSSLLYYYWFLPKNKQFLSIWNSIYKYLPGNNANQSPPIERINSLLPMHVSLFCQCVKNDFTCTKSNVSSSNGIMPKTFYRGIISCWL